MKHIWASCLLLIFVSCKKGGSGGDTPPNTPDPSVSIEDLSLFEGNAGTNTFQVNVKLSAKSSKTVTITYNSAPGTAKATEDFTALNNQTLTFEPGDLEKKIAVTVVADDVKEGDDEFSITISNPLNATILRNKATIIVRNDDTKVLFTNAGYDAPTSYAGYNLVWGEEFDGPTLDNSAWTVEGGNGCPNVCGWGNNEKEFYTGSPENLFFQDGKLIIEAKKGQNNAFNYATDYTSSKILTRDKKMFKYGRVDFRAKLPIGKGIWPAFWMLPQDNLYGGWPTSGEIDIMEMVGHEPNRTHGTLHYGPGPGSTQYNRNTTLATGTLHDEFHVYSIEWEEDEIRWYLDGNLFSTANKANLTLGGAPYPFNDRFFFIINLAVGGNWPGSPDAATYFPQWFIVDYVRVYQKS